MSRIDGVFFPGQVEPLRQAVATGELTPGFLLTISLQWLEDANNYENPQAVIAWAEQLAKVADYGYQIYPDSPIDK